MIYGEMVYAKCIRHTEPPPASSLFSFPIPSNSITIKEVKDVSQHGLCLQNIKTLHWVEKQ